MVPKVEAAKSSAEMTKQEVDLLEAMRDPEEMAEITKALKEAEMAEIEKALKEADDEEILDALKVVLEAAEAS